MRPDDRLSAPGRRTLHLATRSAVAARVRLRRVRDLRPLFDPRSLAVLGASNDPAKWGQWISAGALRGADRRDVWLVNRNGGEILGQQAYRSLAELPGPPELVVIAVPVAAFEARRRRRAGCRRARRSSRSRPVSARSTTAARSSSSRVVEKVRGAGAVMLGPNCLGVYDAAAALDLGMNEFAPGTLGIISQSGNLALELSLLGAQYGIGISRFASLGNQADIEAAELVEAFAADEHTRVIGVYCEDFRDGRAFARAGEAALAGRASRSSSSRPAAARPERARRRRTRVRSRATRPRSRLPAARPGSCA